MAEEVTDTAPEQDADAPAAPDLSEQFADLNNRVTQFIESQQQPEPQSEPLDILDGPAPADEYEDYEYEYEPVEEFDDPASDPRVDQIWEWATQQEQRNITNGLNALDDKYQDFSEKVPEIRDTLDSMGITDPAQRGNAALVERIYLSLKAEADAAAETPAEEAASRGAKIERGASGSAPEEVDPDDQFIKNFGSGREKSVFG
ncbi:MAG: hypothetical protein HUU17_06180 [Chthonomonadales bacterium]|nr:hypothetical protein [Chthonomonadales bacterium]